MKRLISIAAMLVVFGSGAAYADIVINITEAGSSVLFTTSGSLNTTGLMNHTDGNNPKSVHYNNQNSSGDFQTWLAFGSNSQDYYAGVQDGLTDYASTVQWTGSAVGGLGVDLVSGAANFGFRTGFTSIWIPDQYPNGSTVSQVLRRNNASFTTLGLNPGDFAEVSWTTGSGSRETIRMQVSGIPEPSSLVLLPVIGMCSLRRRSRRC